MGFDYALVHLKYTIPPAIALTFFYRPFLNRLDTYKLLFLISIAVVSTTPWDSYLIRRRIWTYPSNVIVGPTLFAIPAEEIFFFIIQTYNTTLLYLLLSKPTFFPSYLRSASISLTQQKLVRFRRIAGQLTIFGHILSGIFLIRGGTEGTYLGLILVWAGPFALLLWTLSHQFLVDLPYTNTVVPIALPTLYLWIVDTLALKRGTWAISSGTKLGVHLWDGLEIEEAVFFLATNVLIVFGLVAFDNAIAILESFPSLFPTVPRWPSPMLLVQALVTDSARYDEDRLLGIQQAVSRLQKKSRSFYLASATFSGRLRIDLMLLYSFCRVADDLVDDAEDDTTAREWIAKLITFLDTAYVSKTSPSKRKVPDLREFILSNFPPASQAAFLMLPTQYLSYGPFYDLIEGFRTDLEFHKPQGQKQGAFPIRGEHDLNLYGSRVAGTVAELCLELVFHHTSTRIPLSHHEHLVHAGGRMGIALQYVNIARDILTDAAISRVYIPTTWLTEENLTPSDVIKSPNGPQVEKLKNRLLKKAFMIYEEAIKAIEELPNEARAPMRVAVESYMEIGRVLREEGYVVKQGKATVPKMRRIRVAWGALSKG